MQATYSLRYCSLFMASSGEQIAPPPACCKAGGRLPSFTPCSPWTARPPSPLGLHWTAHLHTPRPPLLTLFVCPTFLAGRAQRAKTDAYEGLELDNPDRPEARNLTTIYQCVTGLTKVGARLPACLPAGRG